MVYDDRGGVVGDAHLTTSQVLDEGEELTLDRGAAIVQICERTGESEVDLGELVDKRAREVEKRRREATAKQQRARPQGPTRNGGLQPVQQPLSAVMRTPGPIGRAAIPRESPYGQRQQQMRQQEQENTPPVKRRKTSVSPPSKMCHARSLFGTQLTLSARPVRSWSQRSQLLRDSTNVRTQPTSSAVKAPDDDVVMLDEGRQSQKRDVQPERETSSPLEESSDQLRKDENTTEDNSTIRGGTKISRPTGKPHLGGLRASREGTEMEEEKQLEPNTLDTSTRRRKAMSARPQPEGSANDDAVTAKPANTRQKSSFQALKEAATARAYDDTSKRPTCYQLNREETSHPIPRGKKTSSRTELAPIGRSKVTSSNRDTIHASSSGREPPQGDKSAEPAPLRDSQPRTELRIRARKKRGLLMLSEKLPPAESASSSGLANKESSPLADVETENFGESAARGIASDGEVNADDGYQPPSLSLLGKDRSQQDVSQAVPDDSDEDVCPSPPQRLPSTSSAVSKSNVIDEEGADADVTQPAETSAPQDSAPREESPSVSDDSSTNDVPRTRRRRKQNGLSTHISDAPPSTIPDCAYDESQGEDDWNGPAPAATRRETAKKKSVKAKATDKANTGPRISRISRSAKSKEIFGFKLPDDDHVVPTSWATAIGRIGWDDATGAGGSGGKNAQDEQTTQQPASATNKAAGDEGAGSSTTRLANPATRGRKAASEADAAGRIPESFVSFDPILAPTKPAEPKPAPKEPASLPGFSKANGGAWSRHAEDLLGMDRPKGRK